MKERKRIKPMGLSFAPSERPIIEALKLADSGEALVEASDELTTTVKAVREHGGKGKVVITLEIGGAGKSMAMKTTITSKWPKPAKPAIKLFSDEDGRLGQHDPDQYEIETLMEESTNNVASAR